ncbi:hypothetical protein QTP88_012205 [Uroleucon formosanum]
MDAVGAVTRRNSYSSSSSSSSSSPSSSSSLNRYLVAVVVVVVAPQPLPHHLRFTHTGQKSIIYKHTTTARGIHSNLKPGAFRGIGNHKSSQRIHEIYYMSSGINDDKTTGAYGIYQRGTSAFSTYEALVCFRRINDLYKHISCAWHARMTDGDNFCENCVLSPFSLTRHYRVNTNHSCYASA